MLTSLYRFGFGLLLLAPGGWIAAAQRPAAAAPAALPRAAQVRRPSRCMEGVSYEDFVKPYRDSSGEEAANPPELTISSIERDDLPLNDGAARFFGECGQAVYGGVRVWSTGRFATYFVVPDHGLMQDLVGIPMKKEAFAEIESILNRLQEELPGDGGVLPPPGHRLVVIVRHAGATSTRVYDRGNLPNAVLRILRLTQARVEVLAPTLTPAKVWTADEAESLGLPKRAGRSVRRGLASPDGSIRVDHDFVGHVLTVYDASGEKEVRTIHEFWQDSWGDGEGFMTTLAFSRDGLHLQVQWGGQMGVALYDTRTWQMVKDPAVFPQALKAYFPSADWTLGLARPSEGDPFIWDEAHHRRLGTLQGLAEIRWIAFSPDGSEVATQGFPDEDGKKPLIVWDTHTGHLQHELWPVAWTSYPDGQPVWWNGGQWLVQPYWSEFTGGGTGVWDVPSGRFLGTLTFADCNTNGSPAVARESLLQQCFKANGPEGTVLEWTVDGVRAQVEAWHSGAK